MPGAATAATTAAAATAALRNYAMQCDTMRCDFDATFVAHAFVCNRLFYEVLCLRARACSNKWQRRAKDQNVQSAFANLN